MIDIKRIETVITDGLTDFVKCPVIASNQTAPIPKYPYVSYTITTFIESNAKCFCISGDGTKFKQLNQTWSFTSQSENYNESVYNALKIKDYFDLVGRIYLKDNSIVVVNTSGISNRDNIITIRYEYRNGLDVVFRLLDIIEKENDGMTDYIETAQIHNKEW